MSHPSQTASSFDQKSLLGAVRLVLGEQTGPVGLHEPEFEGNEWKYVKECLDTGWVSSVGKYVDRFEEMLAEITGVKRAVAVVNGTSALQVCLRLIGIQPGDEVLIPTLTFIATANAVTFAGATPHFIDSEERTLGVDAVRLAAHLQETAFIRDGRCINRATGAPIRALMPVHIFGHPVDLDALLRVCEEWHLTLVEDAAESLGSYYKGRHTGGFGKVAGLSFNGNKVVTTGGGGAILTNDVELGRYAKHLTTTARVQHQWSFIHDEIGYNFRMPNINAALGCAQLERLPAMLDRKRSLSQKYKDAFGHIPGVHILDEPQGCASNYWLVAMVLDRADVAVRDSVLKQLNEAGFMARPIWTLMHRLPMYRACPRANLDIAEALEARVINLPSSPALAG